jgi:DNA-binding response OmpR family regulator
MLPPSKTPSRTRKSGNKSNATEGEAVETQRSVLIVDRSEENREVLRTVLERQGVRILTASRPKEGAFLARHHQPDVIILDTEYENADLNAFCGEDGEHGEDEKPSMILLGKIRRSPSSMPKGEFFAKPYHYGPLIRRIEEILDTVPRKVA